jgi:hypothetical protein
MLQLIAPMVRDPYENQAQLNSDKCIDTLVRQTSRV